MVQLVGRNAAEEALEVGGFVLRVVPVGGTMVLLLEEDTAQVCLQKLRGGCVELVCEEVRIEVLRSWGEARPGAAAARPLTAVPSGSACRPP
jgi:hypothetical protein